MKCHPSFGRIDRFRVKVPPTLRVGKGGTHHPRYGFASKRHIDAPTQHNAQGAATHHRTEDGLKRCDTSFARIYLAGFGKQSFARANRASGPSLFGGNFFRSQVSSAGGKAKGLNCSRCSMTERIDERGSVRIRIEQTFDSQTCEGNHRRRLASPPSQRDAVPPSSASSPFWSM